jgi:hypothetical protein
MLIYVKIKMRLILGKNDLVDSSLKLKKLNTN